MEWTGCFGSIFVGFHPKEALFPMSGVLRGFSICGVLCVRLNPNPYACLVKCEADFTGPALLIEKLLVSE
jgi:hypothetical protein